MVKRSLVLVGTKQLKFGGIFKALVTSKGFTGEHKLFTRCLKGAFSAKSPRIATQPH